VTDRNYVAYFNFENAATAATNEIVWALDVKPAGAAMCSGTPSANQSVVIVVRNGSLRLNNNVKINGAVFARDGLVVDAVGATLNGSVITKTLQSVGTTTYQIDSCWAENMPVAMIQFEVGPWTELD
jgi:hypothetical protein